MIKNDFKVLEEVVSIIINGTYYNLEDALSIAFPWEYSNEGYQYWKDIASGAKDLDVEAIEKLKGYLELCRDR